MVNGFDASDDQFVFQGFGGVIGNWQLISDSGADVLQVDDNNDSTWDMSIQLNSLTGTLTGGNFSWLI